MAGSRGAAALLVTLIVAGCVSQPPTPTSSPATGQASNAVPAGVSSSPASGGFDPAELRTLAGTGLGSPDQLGAEAAKLGAADRAQLNAGALMGPAAGKLQDGMDAAEGAALQELSSKLDSLGRTGSAGAPAMLAAYHPRASSVPARPGSPLFSPSLALMMGMGSTAMQLFNPKADAPPTTLSVDQDSGSGGVSLSVHATITWGWTAGKLSIAIDLSGNGTRTDPTSGAVTSMTASTEYTISINPCPLSSSGVESHIEVTDEEALTTDGKTVGYRYEGLTESLTIVSEQAEIETTNSDDSWTRSVTTWNPDAKALERTTAGIDGDSTYDAAGKSDGTGEWKPSGTEGSPTPQDYQELGRAVGLLGDGVAISFAMLARDVWRSGRCFEIRPQPDGGSVGPNSQTAVTVNVYHWVDRADIKVPVKATLAGAQKIDPADTPVDAPAKFTFTASGPASTGVVTYRVVSNRGIAERSSTFTVQGGLDVDISGTLDESVGPVGYKLRISAHGIRIRVAPDGTVTAAGSASVTGTATAYVCKGTINERIRVQGTGTVAGTPDAPVYRVLIGPASTQSLGGKFSCPLISVGSNQGDFFGQWSTTIGPVDFPAAGGTFSKSGSTTGVLSRNAAASYTASPVTQ